MALYPLRFQEILRNYTFGNRWIVSLFHKTGLPADHRISETWEVCDRQKESSPILNGPLAGRTLRQAIDEFGEALLGSEMVRRFGMVFPLLVKFLDASQVLGEQLHPSDAINRARGSKDFFGKTEAWYMLAVKPGATIRAGNRDGVTQQQLHDAILDGTSRECMKTYNVQPGQAFLLYAGTMHHTVGGVLFYEIMQNSDLGHSLVPDPRLPDSERRQRADAAVEALHLEDNFECLTRPVKIAADGGANSRTFAIVCNEFATERLDLAAPHTLAVDGRKFYVVSVIEGRASVKCKGSESVTLDKGGTVLVPASAGDAMIEPVGGPASLLKSYVPDLMEDVVRPLRAAGVSDTAISALGGRTILNPLARLLGK